MPSKFHLLRSPFLGSPFLRLTLFGLALFGWVPGLGTAVNTAQAQSGTDSRLFLAGAEPENADMSYVELTWLPDIRAIAPSLTGVLQNDPRLEPAVQGCAESLEFNLNWTEAANVFGGFALQFRFDPAHNAGFEGFLACALEAVQALPPDGDLLVALQSRYYDDVGLFGYVMSLMNEYGYGLAREEFASPVPRPSELYSLTLQDYRSAWPALFDSADVYAVVVTPRGATDLLLAIDQQIDKVYGNPSQAVLPEQPPYSAAPLEGLGLKLPWVERTFYQINRVFVPSISGTLALSSAFNTMIDDRLDTYRLAQGLSPLEDLFIAEQAQEEAQDQEGDQSQEEAQNPQPAPTGSGLLGLLPSSFLDGNYIASFTFLGVFGGPQPMAATVDTMTEAIEAALQEPFTYEEYAQARAQLETYECASAPTAGLARSQAIWLREDLFHGRARTFIAQDVMGCDSLSLEALNQARKQTLENSTTLVFGFGPLVEDEATRRRPFCLVEDISVLEFECAKVEHQL